MPTKIVYRTFGVAQIRAMFNRVIAAVTDWKPAWVKIVRDFYAVEKEQFETQGGRKSRWAPLKSEYAKHKKRTHPGRGILVRTGRMKRSLTTASGPDSVLEISPQELRIGTDSEIAGYHFHGVPKGSGTRMKARRPIDLTRKDKSRWAKIMHEYMAQVARGQK